MNQLFVDHLGSLPLTLKEHRSLLAHRSFAVSEASPLLAVRNDAKSLVEEQLHTPLDFISSAQDSVSLI